MEYTLIRICARPEGPAPVVPLGDAEVLEARAFGNPGLGWDVDEQGRRVRTASEPGNLVRAVNSALSQAAGRWVVFLFADQRLLPGWEQALSRLLDPALCVHVFEPDHDRCLGLPVVRREAFLYGALDERFPAARLAVHHWVHAIFPAGSRRWSSCEGVARHRVDWLDGTLETTAPAAALVALWEGLGHGERAALLREALRRGPGLERDLDALRQAELAALGRAAGDPYRQGGYAPRVFWEENVRGYVKWEVFQPDEPEILEVVERTAPARVLELGCGAGRNARYFATARAYAGLDISMNLLARARTRQGENALGLVCGDAAALGFRDGAFDLVFADSTIQHVVPEQIERAVAEILRVCSRWIALIEFTDEIEGYGRWFGQIHMFRHEYERLFRDRCRLVLKREVALAVQPAKKTLFLFEKAAG